MIYLHSRLSEGHTKNTRSALTWTQLTTSDVLLQDAQIQSHTTVSFRYSALYYKTKSLKGKSVCVCDREAIIEAKRKMLKAQSAVFKPPHAKLTELLLSGSSSDRWHHKTTAANERQLCTDSIQYIPNTLNNQKTGYMSSIKWQL